MAKEPAGQGEGDGGDGERDEGAPVRLDLEHAHEDEEDDEGQQPDDRGEEDVAADSGRRRGEGERYQDARGDGAHVNHFRCRERDVCSHCDGGKLSNINLVSHAAAQKSKWTATNKPWLKEPVGYLDTKFHVFWFPSLLVYL